MRYSRREFLRTSLVLGVGLSIGLTGCSDDGSAPTDAKFAVLSDPHVYDKSLGTSGAAFDSYLADDRKMLVQSSEIMDAMIDGIIEEDVNFVLISGDLTKDGEKACHELMASKLAAFTNAGIQVYVIPGNHDINNPHAVSFSGATTTAVDQVTPADFMSIYSDFGYGTYLAKDPNSLSYIAEPVDGVWLFAIDSCKYDNNVVDPDTSGAIGADTLSWLLGKMSEAKQKGKKMIGMMHHGIIPHFAAQTTFFPEYVVDDHANVGESLSGAGLKIMFTGHFHAQDIVMNTFTNGLMYDVETGSGVTAPCPYRIIDLHIPSEKYEIKSYEIHEIPSEADFDTFKENFVETGMLNLYTTLLAEPAYGGFTDPLLSAIAGAGAEIHVAHYKGDEPGYTNMSAATQNTINNILLGSGVQALIDLGGALVDFAKDDFSSANPVADNNVNLNL